MTRAAIVLVVQLLVPLSLLAAPALALWRRVTAPGAAPVGAPEADATGRATAEGPSRRRAA
jgi:hypothetical protein